MTKRAKKTIEEISVRTYYGFLLWYIERHRGHCTESDLEQAVAEFFAPHWTRADKRQIRVGQHGTQPKWRNQLAWAKVLAGKRNELFQVSVGKGKAKQTILLAGWLVGLADAAARRISGRCMHKKCPKCGAYSPLSAIGCEECGKRFPMPTDKVDLSLDDLVPADDSQPAGSRFRRKPAMTQKTDTKASPTFRRSALKPAGHSL